MTQLDRDNTTDTPGCLPGVSIPNSKEEATGPMIYDSEADNGKNERALKRELDQVFNSDDIGGDNYDSRRDRVESSKKAKRLAKLQKKLRRRKAS